MQPTLQDLMHTRGKPLLVLARLLASLLKAFTCFARAKAAFVHCLLGRVALLIAAGVQLKLWFSQVGQEFSPWGMMCSARQDSLCA